MPPTPSQRISPRTRINSSALVRCLGGLGLGDVSDAGPGLAERLGQWLDWRDAVALHAALQGAESAAAAGPASAAKGRGLAALRDETGRLRSALTQDIAEDAAIDDHGPFDPAKAASLRSHHAALQRAMEMQIGALRERVRAALSAASPALAQLAALDALMERAIAVRERQLLSNVPVLLEQQAACAGDHSPLRRVDGQARQQALLAELDLRLQAVEVLLEAWGAPVAPKPAPDGRGLSGITARPLVDE